MLFLFFDIYIVSNLNTIVKKILMVAGTGTAPAFSWVWATLELYAYLPQL